MRDVILHKKGNESLILEAESLGVNSNGSTNLQDFIKDVGWEESEEEKKRREI